MALMYPWATKEYLLWKCSLGQIVLYHNLGVDMKAGTLGKGTNPRSTQNMSHGEVKKLRDELRAQGYADEVAADKEQSNATKAELAEKYGDI